MMTPRTTMIGTMMRGAQLHWRWQSLTVGTLSDVIGPGPCLVLAPHPDDESLGCGGLIARCCIESRPPLVVILTDGSGSHPGSQEYPPARLAALREEEAARAVQALGLPPERLLFLRQVDTMAPHEGPAFDAIVTRLVACMREFECSTILGPSRLDPHCDHIAAARIAAQTAQRAGARHLSYPVWGWTIADETLVDATVVLGWRLDVTAQLPAKRDAIAAHASQYGKRITDDPDGFRLPVKLLQAVAGPWETFVLP